MIGNDIVDLSLAGQSRWRDERFMSKVLTDTEQKLLRKSADLLSSFWQMWAMKEAAYKVYLQQFPKRFFGPTRFECSGLGPSEVVNYGTHRIGVNTQTTSQYVLAQTTIAAKEQHTKVISVKAVYHSQSQELRTTLFMELSSRYGISTQSFTVEKTEAGIPKICAYGTELPLTLSLTHHGDFAAYSIVYH